MSESHVGRNATHIGPFGYRDRHALVRAIHAAANQYNLLNASAIDRELPTDVSVGIRLHKLSPPVIDALANEPMFEDGIGLMIRSEYGFFSLHRNQIAPKLVNKALSTGSAEMAVNWLEKVLNTKKATGFSIMALRGVAVHELVLLGHGITLMPIGSLPDSSQKQWLTSDDRIFAEIESMPMLTMEAPMAALVVETPIDPLIVKYDATKDQRPTNPSAFSSHELLDGARLALTAVGPSTPIPVCYWFHFKDPDIEEALLGAGRSTPHTEIMPIRIEPFGEFDSEVAAAIVDKYLSMDGAIKKRIKLALERLNQGLRRTSPGDRAMEISIALETLLADGGTENTFKVGLRAALLLGGDITTKRNNRAIVSAAYSMRSALVHSGEVPPETKTSKLGRLRSDEVAHRAAITCADVIKKIIHRGHIPQWYEFELLQGHEI